MRTKIMRVVPAVIATTVLALAMTASPAEAHAIRVSTNVVVADLTANHATLWVCRAAATGRGAWATVRYANPGGPGETLVRYDATPTAGLCISHALASNVAHVRACHTEPTGSNICTAWRAA